MNTLSTKNQTSDKAFRAYRFRVPPDMRGPLVSYKTLDAVRKSPGLSRNNGAFITVEIPLNEHAALNEIAEALKQVATLLNQPVHLSNTRTANAIQILRADSETCRLIASNALANLQTVRGVLK